MDSVVTADDVHPCEHTPGFALQARQGEREGAIRVLDCGARVDELGVSRSGEVLVHDVEFSHHVVARWSTVVHRLPDEEDFRPDVQGFGDQG